MLKIFCITGLRKKRSLSKRSKDEQYARDSSSPNKYLETHFIADQYYSQFHGDNTERDMLMVAHVVSNHPLILDDSGFVWVFGWWMYGLVF